MEAGDKLVRILSGAGVRTASLGYVVTKVRGQMATVAGEDGEKFDVNVNTGVCPGVFGFRSEFIVLESTP